jgi:hypothetical protein
LYDRNMSPRGETLPSSLPVFLWLHATFDLYVAWSDSSVLNRGYWQIHRFKFRFTISLLKFTQEKYKFCINAEDVNSPSQYVYTIRLVHPFVFHCDSFIGLFPMIVSDGIRIYFILHCLFSLIKSLSLCSLSLSP